MLNFNPLNVYGFRLPFTFDPVPVAVNGYKFPPGTSVDVSGKKRIVSTAVPGREGTIKEFLGMDDYRIVLNIVSNHANHLLARREVEDIVRIWETTDDPLFMVCPKTALYGINRVVFEDLSHPHVPGFPGMEVLTLSFLSDTLYEIEIL
jgi:hypothetical protein